jgi:hypothetical protein
MDFLYRLLGVDVPAGTTIEDVDLHFRGGLPWFVVVVLALLLVGGALVVYRFERGRVPLAVRLLLALVRGAALVLLLLLLCRPVLQATFVGPRPREILLLIDNTQSMQQRDRRVTADDLRRVALAGLPDAKNPSRADLVKAVLNNDKLDLLAGLQKQAPLTPMLFGASARGAGADPGLTAKRALTAKDVLAKFTAEESETALADVLEARLDRKDVEPPAAIVVFTDGCDTVARHSLDKVADKCKKRGVPLHIYGVGSAESASLKLTDLLVDNTLFAKDKVPVTVLWRADGVVPGMAEVTATLAGKSQTRKVAVTPGKQQATEFNFDVPEPPPGEKGKAQNREASATVRLLSADGTGSPDKDSRSQPVRIIDGKVKILYAEYAPRKDFKFLEPILLDDHRLEPRFWLITADPEALKGGPFEKEFPKTKDKLNEFDLVILGDIPPEKLSKKSRELLAHYVSEDRGGLVVLAGRQFMPAAYAGEDFKEFARLLPVDFVRHTFPPDAPSSPVAYVPQRTEAAKRAPWLTLDKTKEESDKLWQTLPGLYWHYPVTDLRGGAEVLLEHPTVKMPGGALDPAAGEREKQFMPLLAWHRYGKGQVMFVGFEESWRWRFNTDRKVFGRFWSQVLLRMALLHKGTGLAELEVSQGGLELGKPGTLYARLLKPSFEPVTDDKVKADLEYLDEKGGVQDREKVVLTLEAVPGKPGSYRAVLPNDRPGLWRVTLTSPGEGAKRGEKAELTFRVKLPPKHELQETPMAAEALRNAAQASAGRFYREEDLNELVAAVRPQETTFHQRQEVLLWGWIPFLLFVGFVSTEWVLRKFANLS